MSKRNFSVLFLILCGIFLTGCNEVIDLTDEESALIAEYAAEMLLKYDLGYEDRIVEGNKQVEKPAEMIESIEVVPGTSQESTEEAITEIEDAVKPNVADMGEGDAGTSVVKENDIAKIVGLPGVSITYKDYKFTNRYPEDNEYGSDINLEAQSGYQLLVIRFNVENITEDVVSVSLLDKMVDYRIVWNDSKTANSMLTILPEDLSTLEESLNPGKSQEAVLIFQISDGLRDELESLELMIQYGGVDNLIKIL